ncbi:MAG TPA: metallophosphoesterase [Casimicrobiaceae bacterium]|nr:metallophosphoesterase [Casimicrobiaceae bacterium]
MRLNILSDLHLSCGLPPPPDNDADVVILAGDIARPPEAIAWASALGKPVLYVAGNHEFYGGTPDGTLEALRRHANGTAVIVLDDDEVVIDGVRFLGTTLWTDFRLEGDGPGRELAMQEASLHMRDFTRIRIDDGTPFTPRHAADRFDRHAGWLATRLRTPHDGPTVVVTHHAPSPASVHPRFAGSPLNPCYASDAEHLLGGERACLWIHGHMHDSFDYVRNGTRVVCNPRGYAVDGLNENRSFDPDLVIEVPR